MELKEISASNTLDGVVQEIDLEGSFTNIAVDVGNRDYIYSNVNLDVLYEDTLEEIYLERARYLLSTDDMLEEMLDKDKIN